MPRSVASYQNPHSYPLSASAGPFEHHRKGTLVSEEDDGVTVGGVEVRSEEVFRVIDRPAEVDSSKVTATLLLLKVAAGGEST